MKSSWSALLVTLLFASFLGASYHVSKPCCSWTVGGEPVPHVAAFKPTSVMGAEDETNPDLSLVAPAWPGTNCYGLALYPVYRRWHPEGLYLSDRAAEMICNAEYRPVRPPEEIRRGDVLAYIVRRPSVQDPARTIRHIYHLAVFWEYSDGRWMVLSKFDGGPIYLCPANYQSPQLDVPEEVVPLRRLEVPEPPSLI